MCFGLSALFAKGAYAGGASVTGMLIWRFLLAASILWVVVSLRRPALPAPRVVLTAVGLGALGYALQSGLYFGAIARLDAGLAALLLYVYPAIVTLIGISRRRESPSVRKAVALACSAVGLALLLGLGGLGSAKPAGVAFALGAAVTYSVYTVVAATIPRDTDVFLVAAIIITSAFASLLTATALTSAPLSLGPPSDVWVWVSAFAVVGTVVALALHQAGLQRVGPSTTAILSCVEPVVAALSVAVVQGERLTLGQLLGGAAVLAGVVVLQLRSAPSLPLQRQTGPLAGLRRAGPLAGLRRALPRAAADLSGASAAPRRSGRR